MSSAIPQSFIQDLLNRVDIVDIIQVRVNLKKRGANYTACCPFHNEKTPSFTVSQEKQFYYCFGCGAHGNALSFLMNFDRMEFVEAVESLAASAGLEVPCEEKISSEKTASTNALYTITEKAAQFYEQQLKKSSAAIEYLKKRGLSGQIAKYFRLGFSVNEWDALYKTLSSQNKEVLKDSGLFIDNNGRFYDRFRNRVMFPIRDIRGRVIAFGGRTFTDEQPKYLNSPETPIFHKSFELYGLYEAKQKNKTLVRALMVEGYMDVISLAEQGITYAAATLGTAINIKHVQKLLRYTHEIIFCFDGDQAGQNAAKKALEITLPLIRDDIKIRFMFLPEEDDPDSLIQKIGKQAFEKLMDESQTISDFFFDQLKKEIPIRSLDDKARFAERALKQLEKVPQGIFKNLMEQQLANLLSVEPEQLKRLVFSAETKKHPVNISLQRMHPADLIMALLLNRPALIELIQDTQSWQFFKFEHKDFFDLLIMTLKQHPHIKAGDLLTKMDPQYHPLIAKLAAWEFSFPESGIEAEFLGAIECLNQLSQEKLRQYLIQKAKKTSLNESEKQKLTSLLKNKFSEVE